MTSSFKSLFATAVLATLGGVAVAQSHSMPMPGGAAQECAMGQRMVGHEGMGARHMQRMDRHLGELKNELKLSASQEAAWNAFVAAMKPGADKRARQPDRAELAALRTPERLDRMKALRTQHLAEMTAAMERREQATRALYDSLSLEQKAQFDARTARAFGPRGHHAG